MRLELCEPVMIQKSGLLNLDYFKVKKGQYWSSVETQILKNLVIIFGAYDSQRNVYQQIKNADYEGTHQDDHGNLVSVNGKPLKDFEEIEIRLRVAKLLGIFDLSCYEGKQFKTVEEVDQEAKINQQRFAEGCFDKSVKVKGGVVFNPRPEDQPQTQRNFVNSFFRKTAQKSDMCD